jgi:hypothetical protein
VREMRVIDTGETLTMGLVTFSPFGDPASVDLEIFEATSLSELRGIVEDIEIALRKPVVSLSEVTG